MMRKVLSLASAFSEARSRDSMRDEMKAAGSTSARCPSPPSRWMASNSRSRLSCIARVGLDRQSRAMPRVATP